jgi:hypothetical protein
VRERGPGSDAGSERPAGPLDSILNRGNADAGGFAATQAQAIVLQTDLHRTTERREAENFQFFPFENTHFEEALNNEVIARDGFNACPLANMELVKRRH